MKLKYSWTELKRVFGFTNEQIQRLIERNKLIPENWGVIDQKKALLERNILFVIPNITDLIREMTDIYLGIHAVFESIEALRYSINENSAILERIDRKITASIYPISLHILEEKPFEYKHQYLLNRINKFIKENPNFPLFSVKSNNKPKEEIT